MRLILVTFLFLFLGCAHVQSPGIPEPRNYLLSPPSVAEAYRDRAVLLYSSGRYADSFDSFAIAIIFDPDIIDDNPPFIHEP